jgi:hypothetical protein
MDSNGSIQAGGTGLVVRGFCSGVETFLKVYTSAVIAIGSRYVYFTLR